MKNVMIVVSHFVMMMTIDDGDPTTYRTVRRTTFNIYERRVRTTYNRIWVLYIYLYSSTYSTNDILLPPLRRTAVHQRAVPSVAFNAR